MVVRRTPFSDNPQVGARGQRTGRRILDAARTVLARTGYHRCSVESITREAGFSRATFYQYFADKEAAFAELAAEVADDLRHAAKTLRPVTADPDGWQALRDWVDAYAAVYDRHEAVFQNFATAAAADPVVARALRRGAGHHRAAIRERVVSATLAADVIDAVIDVATPTLVRTLDDASVLRRTARTTSAALRDVQLVRPALLDAFVDVVHRTLFGLMPDVNVHDHAFVPLSDERGRSIVGHGDDGPTRRALLHAARRELAERGFHGTTIDSIAERAGTAHGTFYRYFANKEAVTLELVTEASQNLSIYFAELAEILAGPPAAADLRSWLGRYVDAQLGEMVVLRVWAEAALVDDQLLADAAPMLEWGRRRVARSMAGRGFAGVQSEALVLVAMVDSLGSAVRPTVAIDAATVIIERGFLGRDR